DPLAREVVGDADGEVVVAERRAAHLAEPGGIGGVVERFAEPGGYVIPEAFRRQLGLPLHAWCPLLGRPAEAGEHTSVPEPDSMRISRPVQADDWRDLQGFFTPPHDSPQVWKVVSKGPSAHPLSTPFVLHTACG